MFSDRARWTPAAVSDPAWKWHFKDDRAVERERAVSRRRPSHADDEDCEFADPFVSFNGRQRFIDNLANLAGGFITDSSVRPISSSLEGLSYKTKLMVKLQLALPWSPVLAWPWGVEHVLEERDEAPDAARQRHRHRVRRHRVRFGRCHGCAAATSCILLMPLVDLAHIDLALIVDFSLPPPPARVAVGAGPPLAARPTR